MFSVKGLGVGIENGHLKAWTGEEGRETKGREEPWLGILHRGKAARSSPQSPSTWPFTRAAPAQEASGVLMWGGWAQVAYCSLLTPHPYALSSSLFTPCLLSQATPCSQPGFWASIISSHGGSYSPKYRHLTQNFKQCLELLGQGWSFSFLRLLPTLGFRGIVKVMDWKKGNDGQEVTEGSVGSVSVCSSWTFPTIYFPPGASGCVR